MSTHAIIKFIHKYLNFANENLQKIKFLNYFMSVLASTLHTKGTKIVVHYNYYHKSTLAGLFYKCKTYRL